MRIIEDHSPCQYEQHRDATLLLSFDEFAELRDSSWLREATEEEIEAELQILEGRDDIDQLTMDSTGRPYMWVTVTKDAPGHIWRQATGHLRIHRFKEEA